MTKKIKLYWFHPHFYNWMGGHKFIFEVISILQSKYNVEVILITSGLNKEAKNRFKNLNITILKLLPFSTNSLIYWLFLPLFLILEKMYLLYVKKIDTSALFISSMFPANVLMDSISDKGLQLCYEPFAFFYDKNFINGFTKVQQLFIAILSFFYKGIDTKSIKKAVKIFTISKLNAKMIVDSYKADINKVIVIYEGVDIKFFRNTKSEIFSKKYIEYKCVFHSTDYTNIKGTEFLIKALPNVIKIIPNLKVIISETIPNSKSKNKILELIDKLKLKNYVDFVGFLPYELLPQYLSQADVVVQPSINQSMNLTIKEAMACETQIITSLDGYEQTKDGEAGYLIDPHNTSSLSSTIIECLNNKKEANIMGKRGRKIIKAKFSWDSVTKKIWKELKK